MSTNTYPTMIPMDSDKVPRAIFNNQEDYQRWLNAGSGETTDAHIERVAKTILTDWPVGTFHECTGLNTFTDSKINNTVAAYETLSMADQRYHDLDFSLRALQEQDLSLNERLGVVTDIAHETRTATIAHETRIQFLEQSQPQSTSKRLSRAILLQNDMPGDYVHPGDVYYTEANAIYPHQVIGTNEFGKRCRVLSTYSFTSNTVYVYVMVTLKCSDLMYSHHVLPSLVETESAQFEPINEYTWFEHPSTDIVRKICFCYENSDEYRIFNLDLYSTPTPGYNLPIAKFSTEIQNLADTPGFFCYRITVPRKTDSAYEPPTKYLELVTKLFGSGPNRDQIVKPLPEGITPDITFADIPYEIN